MTQIRSIAAGELPALTELAGPEHAADQASYVSNMIDRGAMRPDWCFVAEDDGRLTGRYGFWTMPSVDHPEAIVLLDVAADASDADSVAAELLAHALAGARAAGSPTLMQVLDEPPQWPQWQTDLEARARWLQTAGFELRRATSRFELRGDGADRTPDSATEPPPSPVASAVAPARLTFRNLETVGEAAFLDAIERVSTDSLDRYTRDERDRLGPEGEARQTYDELRSMAFEPSWWELAYDADDNLVGLVMPARSPTFLTIGYIGIVPEQRGHGYVNDLLARGTATLRAASGDDAIRADTDLDNAPMAAAFERAGYRRFATRREYEIRL